MSALLTSEADRSPHATRNGATLPGVLVMVPTLEIGGAEKQAVSLVNGLDRAQFRVGMCHIKGKDPLSAQVDHERVEVLTSLNAGKSLDRAALKRLAAIIDRHEFDIVICSNGYAATYALVASWLCRRRVRIVEIWHTTGTGVQSRRFRFRMWMNKWVFSRCDLLVYVSELQRQYWAQIGLKGRKTVVIHNGIDTRHFSASGDEEQIRTLRAQLGFAPGDLVVGLCAAMRPEKKHGDLLQAVARLRSSGISAKALFIGDGRERPSIEKQIEQMGLRAHVHITGYQNDVRPFIRAADVIVLTSHSVETFSIAALEAMALGKPMVMTRIGGAAEQVTDGVNGYLFERGDIEALTQKLALLTDETLRARLGRNALQLVRTQFTTETMLAAFTRELQTLVAPTRPGLLGTGS